MKFHFEVRKFAVEIASSHQHQHEENKKPKVEAEVVLEQTETEKVVMNIDMEDILEEAVLDIDSCDINNPLAPKEYVEDFYAYFQEVEDVLKSGSSAYQRENGEG